MDVYYLPSFIKEFKQLPTALQEEVVEKIELFKHPKNHRQLKVHKLHGRLKNRYSFSVNYRYRIVFVRVSKDAAAFLAIGGHEVYDR